MLDQQRTFLFCCLFVYTYGELVLTQKPSYVSLEEKVDTIKVSDVQSLLAAIHGFTLHKEMGFNGLYASSPFNHPQASAVVTLYGGEDVIKQLGGSKLNLKPDDVYVPLQILKHHLHQFLGEESNVVEIGHESKVSDFDGLLESLSDRPEQVMSTMNEVFRTKVLNLTEPEVGNLVRQASLIIQSLKLVKKAGQGHGDLYSFELYVPTIKNMEAQREINALVSAVLEKVKTMMVDMYGDDSVVIVLSLPESSIIKTRKTRSLLAAEDDAEDPDPNNVNEWLGLEPEKFTVPPTPSGNGQTTPSGNGQTTPSGNGQTTPSDNKQTTPSKTKTTVNPQTNSSTVIPNENKPAQSSEFKIEPQSSVDTDKINLAEAWTEDYPVIFHIILWLVVFMALVTIFVTHGMMTMDPGNDSIIYRMTTTRLKRE